MRILLDTNVVVSALLWQGATHQLLHAIRANHRVQLFSSVALIEELADVLNRKECLHRLALCHLSVDKVLSDYVTAVHLVEPSQISTASIDPDDNVVLATAMAARAEAIVSGDRKHLLILEQFEGIPIITVAQAVTMVERA